MPLFVESLYTCDYKSLVSGSENYWTESTTTSGVYYYNQNDLIEKPLAVIASGTVLTEGTLGSLSDNEWAWGDQDSINDDRIYVKIPEGDPDTQADDYVKCSEPKTVFQADSVKETGLRSIFISNYSTTKNASVWIQRTDSLDKVKFKGFIAITQGQSPFSWSDLFNMNTSDKFKIHSSVEEVCVQINGVEK
jgi:hypothetical protein